MSFNAIKNYNTLVEDEVFTPAKKLQLQERVVPKV